MKKEKNKNEFNGKVNKLSYHTDDLPTNSTLRQMFTHKHINFQFNIHSAFFGHLMETICIDDV